jgi:AbrB family looped-hinge helix DNA binding protein
MTTIVENAKVSSKGQIVIPASIRKALNIQSGDQVEWTLSSDGKLSVIKAPSAQEWSDLLDAVNIPVEQVEMDEDGHYDPKKSPRFHDWMVNG